MHKNVTYLTSLISLLLKESVNSLPTPVIKKTQLSLFDFIGVLLCGDANGVLNPLSDKYFSAMGGKEESTCLPGLKKIPAFNAAFCTGVKAHSVELDDGHRHGTSHPAVAVIPAALAVAEREKSSMYELIYSICMGYEVMLRTARSINPSHLKRGFHTTGTAGTFGSAMASALLLKLSEADICHAISIGGLQSAGLQEMLHENPSIKPLQPGKAAQAGVLAADLVKLGAKAPMSIYEGQHGWIKAMTDNFNENDLLADIGKRWEILNCYTKLYPTCRHCHQGIDIAIEMSKEIVDLNSIKNINIDTYSVAISEVGSVFYPKNLEEAMFSLPFSFALGLKIGRVGLKEVILNLNNTELHGVIEKISINENQEMNSAYPYEKHILVKFVFKNGTEVSKHLALPKGEFDTPLTDEEYLEKAIFITDGIVSKKKIENIYDFIMSGFKNKDVAELINLITS